jgi:hypothetical protein
MPGLHMKRLHMKGLHVKGLHVFRPNRSQEMETVAPTI